MARVVFHDPFLEILGGGEKVLLTILEDVAASGRHEVVVLSSSRPELAAWRRLNIEVDPRHVRWRRANQLSATPLSANADLFVALVNHFPPLSLARRSAAIVQFPLAALRDGPLGRLRARERRLRVGSYDDVVAYSRFVGDAVRHRLEVPEPLVIPPPVDLPPATGEPPARERSVIAVGRFFAGAETNNKKHDVLIDAWRALESDARADGWRLHLAGGVRDDPASMAHLATLRARAAGARIDFHPNIAPDALGGLYRRSSLFWHAAGYGEAMPERHEHFGITTVEAMAHGCVPVVVGLGGQVEIVRDGIDGRLWQRPEELVSISAALMADPTRTARLGQAARAAAARFGKAEFVRAVREHLLAPAGVDVS